MNVNGIACFGTGDGFSYCGQGYLEIKDRGVAAKFDLREYVDESSRSMTFVHTSRVITLGRIGHCLDQRSRGGFYGVAVSVLADELVDLSDVVKLSNHLDEMMAAFRDTVFFDSQQIRGRLAHDDLRKISIFRPNRSEVTIEQDSNTLEQRFAFNITGQKDEAPNLSYAIAASLIKPFGQGLNILSINHSNSKELRLPFDNVASAQSLIFTQAVKLRKESSALIDSLQSNITELKIASQTKRQASEEALTNAELSYKKMEQKLEQKLSRRNESIRQLKRKIARLDQVGNAYSHTEIQKQTNHNTHIDPKESVVSNDYERDLHREDRSEMTSTGGVYSYSYTNSNANEYADQSSTDDLSTFRVGRFQVICISTLLSVLIALFLASQPNLLDSKVSKNEANSTPQDGVSNGESSAPKKAVLKVFNEYKPVFRAARREMGNYEASTPHERFLEAAIVKLPNINQDEIPHFCKELLEYAERYDWGNIEQREQQLDACVKTAEESNKVEASR